MRLLYNYCGIYKLGVTSRVARGIILLIYSLLFVVPCVVYLLHNYTAFQSSWFQSFCYIYNCQEKEKKSNKQRRWQRSHELNNKLAKTPLTVISKSSEGDRVGEVSGGQETGGRYTDIHASPISPSPPPNLFPPYLCAFKALALNGRHPLGERARRPLWGLRWRIAISRSRPASQPGTGRQPHCLGHDDWAIDVQSLLRVATASYYWGIMTSSVHPSLTDVRLWLTVAAQWNVKLKNNS